MLRGVHHGVAAGDGLPDAVSVTRVHGDRLRLVTAVRDGHGARLFGVHVAHHDVLHLVAQSQLLDGPAAHGPGPQHGDLHGFSSPPRRPASCGSSLPKFAGASTDGYHGGPRRFPGQDGAVGHPRSRRGRMARPRARGARAVHGAAARRHQPRRRDGLRRTVARLPRRQRHPEHAAGRAARASEPHRRPHRRPSRTHPHPHGPPRRGARRRRRMERAALRRRRRRRLRVGLRRHGHEEPGGGRGSGLGAAQAPAAPALPAP